MHRRDLLKLGASFAATLAAVPTVWGQEAAKQAAKPGWRPSVLSAHENESAIAITEIIIPATDTPGAKVAHVNRYIDLLLRDGPLDQRERFLGGLAWLDAYAIREHGHAFVKCSPADQVAMLKALDGGTGVGHTFFREAKSLTSKIYYATEIGQQELNKGGRVPASFGCQHGTHA
jgi:gluconate 2-dehydrogenase gamma chain